MPRFVTKLPHLSNEQPLLDRFAAAAGAARRA